MMVSGAPTAFEFEDRAEAVRRALGGLAGAKKSSFGFGTSNNKPVVSMQPSPLSQPPLTSMPRIPLDQAPANEDSKKTEMKPGVLHAASIQPGPTTVSKSGGTTTVKDAQDLLCQLRQTEKQPIRGLEGDTAVHEVAAAAQPIQRPGRVHRARDLVGRNGKKKTEIEKENDRLLDELEALGEPAVEIPGETPVDQNQRLRREATAAMLKHSFFAKKRSSPPTSAASGASGGFSNR